MLSKKLQFALFDFLLELGNHAILTIEEIIVGLGVFVWEMITKKVFWWLHNEKN